MADAERVAEYGSSVREVPGWARGLTVFAAVMLLMIGAFQALAGLAAIFENTLYVTTPGYVFQLDVTAWGWIHLIFGVFMGMAGFSVLSGRLWARSVGITLAVLSAIANFLFIPYYPFWSLLIITLDIFVIWALSVHGRDITA